MLTNYWFKFCVDDSVFAHATVHINNGSVAFSVRDDRVEHLLCVFYLFPFCCLMKMFITLCMYSFSYLWWMKKKLQTKRRQRQRHQHKYLHQNFPNIKCIKVNWIYKEIVNTEFIWNAKEKVQPASTQQLNGCIKNELKWSDWIKERSKQMSRSRSQSQENGNKNRTVKYWHK